MNVLYCAKSPQNITTCSSHSHPEWEVIYHLAGSNTTLIDNTSYNIKKGDIIVIPPNVRHEGISDTFYSDMYFQTDKLDFFSHFSVHDFDGSVLTLMNMLHKVMTEKEENYDQIAITLVETICQYIKKYSEIKINYPVVNELKNIIYKNISNPAFNLSSEINNSGFNSDYFRRCFKKALGKTPLEYLTYLRLNQSKMLLKQDTFISIEDVSKNCGFNDSFYFSTCFKKHIGVPPLQYRKKYLADKNNR